MYYSFTHLKCEIGWPIVEIYSPGRGIRRFNRTELAICEVDFKNQHLPWVKEGPQQISPKVVVKR